MLVVASTTWLAVAMVARHALKTRRPTVFRMFLTCAVAGMVNGWVACIAFEATGGFGVGLVFASIAALFGGPIAGVIVGVALVPFLRAMRRLHDRPSLMSYPYAVGIAGGWIALVAGALAAGASRAGDAPLAILLLLLACLGTAMAVGVLVHRAALGRWLSRVRRGEEPGFQIVHRTAAHAPLLPVFPTSRVCDRTLLHVASDEKGPYRRACQVRPLALLTSEAATR
jgi:hypothetical protein